MKTADSLQNGKFQSKIAYVITAILLAVLIDAVQIFAQQKVDKNSFDSAIKTLREKTGAPLRMPTLFMPPSHFTPEQKLQPLLAKVVAADAGVECAAVIVCVRKIERGAAQRIIERA